MATPVRTHARAEDLQRIRQLLDVRRLIEDRPAFSDADCTALFGLTRDVLAGLPPRTLVPLDDGQIALILNEFDGLETALVAGQAKQSLIDFARNYEGLARANFAEAPSNDDKVVSLESYRKSRPKAP